MPTATLTNGNDWFGAAPNWNLSPCTIVRNGTINFGKKGSSWWGIGANAIDLEVGDGDMRTAAIVNLGWGIVNHYLHNRSNGLVIKVNADGTINHLTNLVYREEQTFVTKIELNGGSFKSSGTVTSLATGANDSLRTVSFDATGAEFSARFGGDFVDIAAVNAQIGDSFVDNVGNGLVAVDNLDGSFSVRVIPKP